MSSPASKEIRTMKDFLNETEINLLECKVCFEKFSQQQRHRPRNLPCGHVICQECVSSLCPPGNPRLECPFCRKPCRILETSVCLPILHVIELIGRVVLDNVEHGSSANASHQVKKLKSASFNLTKSFGGWGILFNPTGIAICKKTGYLVVSHDGTKRISIFTMNGTCIQKIGTKSDSANGIVYPSDVAVTLDGYIVVADTGDHSVKVFSQSGQRLLVLKQPFCLPWGLGINPENEVIVSDPDAGNLILVSADFKQGKVKKVLNVCSHLDHPREVAVCPTSGTVVVVEHVTKISKNPSRTQIKIFNNGMKLIRQIDSFGLSLYLPLPVHTTGVAFDQQGNILIADINNRCIICVDKMEERNFLKHVVASCLSYPVALALLPDNSIAVLDSGNNSVIVYSP
ncbi:E3 ubiquitin- ligase NHLRC1 [Pelobates cultripes]|uniref:RING-type E3 ubiquitin transferase n=1 Tax=Pelobates cultripes TaxID=61616 RepID=A0AAD1S3S6_PELCU|nr:E3 ubiquitin- ligase NHLRC1 [Pelobates cultripes]